MNISREFRYVIITTVVANMCNCFIYYVRTYGLDAGKSVRLVCANRKRTRVWRGRCWIGTPDFFSFSWPLMSVISCGIHHFLFFS